MLADSYEAYLRHTETGIYLFIRVIHNQDTLEPYINLSLIPYNLEGELLYDKEMSLDYIDVTDFIQIISLTKGLYDLVPFLIQEIEYNLNERHLGSDIISILDYDDIKDIIASNNLEEVDIRSFESLILFFQRYNKQDITSIIKNIDVLRYKD